MIFLWIHSLKTDNTSHGILPLSLSPPACASAWTHMWSNVHSKNGTQIGPNDNISMDIYAKHRWHIKWYFASQFIVTIPTLKPQLSPSSDRSTKPLCGIGILESVVPHIRVYVWVSGVALSGTMVTYHALSGIGWDTRGWRLLYCMMHDVHTVTMEEKQTTQTCTSQIRRNNTLTSLIIVPGLLIFFMIWWPGIGRFYPVILIFFWNLKNYSIRSI